MADTIHIELPQGVDSVSRALRGAGHDALLVGGVVRDALLGVASADFDLVTTATPADVRALCSDLPGVRTVYELGERFGTVGVALDEGRLEVSRYRPDALEQADTSARYAVDATHRDFTVNALALDLASNELLDPVGGKADLERKLLRAPVEPAERFAEDPLRVLRAARFVAELGFEIEPETALAMQSAASRLRDVAVERVREELGKLLVGPHAPRGLRVLLGSGALRVVLPEVAALDGVTQPTFHDLDVFAHTIMSVGLAPPTLVLRWAALLHDVGKAPARTVEPDGRIRFFRHAQTGAEIAEQICARLRMSSADTSAIVHLVAEHMRWGDVNLENPRSVDRAVRKLDLDVPGTNPPRKLVTAEDAVELTIADFAATAHRDETPVLRERLQDAVAESRERGTQHQVVSPISGTELMKELALDAGRSVGIAKDAIELAIETGELNADDREGALRVARTALADARDSATRSGVEIPDSSST
ncbi:MAG TPA: HD domain-containing protein [Coriobacteriia bacterium]|nr:HD domain-containing protein [Coriobacteriia bacterium]